MTEGRTETVGEPAPVDELEELAGHEETAKELRGAAKQLGTAVAHELASLFVQWVKTRPLKRLIRKRRAASR